MRITKLKYVFRWILQPKMMKEKCQRYEHLKHEYYRRDEELGRFYKCGDCGSKEEATRIVTRGPMARNLVGGNVVSGKLWYCPKCDRPYCIPCSKHYDNASGTGVLCPRCGGHYDYSLPRDRLLKLHDEFQAIVDELNTLDTFLKE